MSTLTKDPLLIRKCWECDSINLKIYALRKNKTRIIFCNNCAYQWEEVP